MKTPKQLKTQFECLGAADCTNLEFLQNLLQHIDHFICQMTMLPLLPLGWSELEAPALAVKNSKTT
jgi:hypothetical protein